MDNNLRVKQVYLTDKGKVFVDKEITNMHKMEENVWNAMNETERKQITELVYKYKSLLAEEIRNYQKLHNSSEDV